MASSHFVYSKYRFLICRNVLSPACQVSLRRCGEV